MAGERNIAVAIAVCLTALLDVAAPGLFESMLAPLTKLTVAMVSTVLGQMDVTVVQTGSVLSHVDGFAYDITYRCTGYRPLLLLAGLLVVDNGVANLGRVLMLGVVILLSMNLLRLLCLFWLGVLHPAWFATAHELLWPLVFLATVLCLWAGRRSYCPAIARSFVPVRP